MNENVSAQERHWHWEFLAYDEAVGSQIEWAVAVSVIGYLDEATAKLAAQDIVQRKEIRLRRVWECNTCGYQGRVADTLSRLADAAS